MKAIVEGKQVELTDWFPPEVKPVRPGWYHTGLGCTYPSKISQSSRKNWYWDGKSWRNGKNDWHCELQNRWWRGLTKPFDQS